MADDPFARDFDGDPFERVTEAPVDIASVHRYKAGPEGFLHRCATERRGYATPYNESPEKLRVDAHLGFVPLWAKDVTLRWRFREESLQVFRNPEAAKAAVRQLMGEALIAWGDFLPVKFSEQRDVPDFEVVMIGRPDCDASGCVLASAFFPDQGQHELNIYPTLFEQSRQEQIETLAHELGHVFGLRHWFAALLEKEWRSELYGTDSEASIMNYNENSYLTETDRRDLKDLYTNVWSGLLTKINGTDIRLFKPYSSRQGS